MTARAVAVAVGCWLEDGLIRLGLPVELGDKEEEGNKVVVVINVVEGNRNGWQEGLLVGWVVGSATCCNVECGMHCWLLDDGRLAGGEDGRVVGFWDGVGDGMLDGLHWGCEVGLIEGCKLGCEVGSSAG